MRNFLSTATAAALLPLAFTLPVQAEDWDFSMAPGPVVTHEASDTEIRLRGRVYYDVADIDWSSPLTGAPTDDDEFRTARLGVQAERGPLKFVAEFDFASDDVKTNDLLVRYATEFGSFQFGYFKTMNSLEEQTSSRYGSFMERSMGTDLFGLGRRIGAAWFWSGSDFTVAAGLFGAPMDNNFAFRETDDSSAAALRVTWSREIDGNRIHLGGSWRGTEYDGGTRVRVYPQAHLSNRFAAADYRTGAALGEADSSDYLGLEAAWIRGPFHVHSEISRLELDGPAGNPAFDTAFIEGGWFLTGESRGYKTSSGSFNRITPAAAISDGGPGAWQIVARLDHADLGDAGLGDIDSFSAGVNWHLERHARLMLNYVTSEHSAPAYTETSDTVQMRLQLDF